MTTAFKLGRFFIIALLLLPFSATFAQKGKMSVVNHNVRIKVPAAWIEKIRHYKTGQSKESLLKDFERFIKPHVFDEDGDTHFDDFEIVKPLFANLDGEPGDELICLLGWNWQAPFLTVFKKNNNSWYLLYLEQYSSFYDMPDITVAATAARNKIFYFRTVLIHGSPIYCDAYRFYRLINNKVYLCLQLINDSRGDFYHIFVNHDVSLKFRFDDKADKIIATYSYTFYTPQEYEDLGIPCQSITLAERKEDIPYVWDNKHFAYKPFYYPGPYHLNDQKIAYFVSWGEDSLFTHVYHDEVARLLTAGDSREKKCIEKFLEVVRKDGRVP